MISPETIDRDYHVLYGKDKYNPDSHYQAVVAHCHFVGDTTSRISRMVHAAADAGVDVLTVTDHDTTRAQDKVRAVVSENGYKIEVFPGIEVTAWTPKKERRHVLVYGVEDAPPTGLSPVEVNIWAHKQGSSVLTAAAHPEMLDFSVREAELGEIQALNPNERFDLGEIANGAIAGIDVWRDKHPLLSRLLKAKMPDPRTNQRMQDIVFAQKTMAPIGGSDTHEYFGVANVVNLVPEESTLFEAALEGKLIIIQKRQEVLHPPTLLRIGGGMVRAKILDRNLAQMRDSRT